MMTRSEFFRFLRKYWHLALIALLVLCMLGYIIYRSGDDPKQLLRDYGYYVILVWTFLEGETIVIVAGALSKALDLKPWLIALCAFSGSFLSDQLMFTLGRYKGKDALRHFPRVVKNLDKASILFKKYDTVLILGFRFVYGVRNITPIMLSISGVSHKKFFILNFIGAAVWAVTFTYGGLLAGKAFQKAMHTFGHGVLYVLLAALACTLLVWYIKARSSAKKTKDIAEPCAQEGEKESSPECRDLHASEQSNTNRD